MPPDVSNYDPYVSAAAKKSEAINCGCSRLRLDVQESIDEHQKVKKEIRAILRGIGQEDAALKVLPIVRRCIWVLRRLVGREKRIIKKYLRENTIIKLHVGCGGHILGGWLNADWYPLSLSACHLDATRRFPYADSTFDFVFSEHMIEHVTYPQGVAMLSECHRVLKKGGRIRLSTPDLAFMLALSREDRSETEAEYIEWATGSMIQGAPYPHATFVINHFVRSWGHQFIYDEQLLTDALRRAGFSSIVRCGLNMSAEPALCGLENEGRMPDGFLRLETMTLEAVKTTA